MQWQNRLPLLPTTSTATSHFTTCSTDPCKSYERKFDVSKESFYLKASRVRTSQRRAFGKNIEAMFARFKGAVS